MAAPEGNRNAIKERKGIQVNFYLDILETEFIRQELERIGEDNSDQAIRRYARRLSKNGIALEIHGKCSVDGCTCAGIIGCQIGVCAPLTKYCTYHYEQAHLPEDERDEPV